jgi:glycosyltransferase involved in cell wall biosynthesis
MPSVTVIMPTYNQSAFIRRAIDSLCAQTFTDWELLIVNDGSPDETRQAVQPYLDDDRIHYHAFEHNRGLGAALNYALDRAAAPLVAYLPSDDVYYSNHLSTLVEALEKAPQAFLAFTGLRHHYNRISDGQVSGSSLQLVQVMHRLTPDRWTERSELESDDLERLFWSKLRQRGQLVSSGQISCEWVDHPHQRHKIMREPVGGINPFRLYYQVQEPLRYHTTTGNFIDEVEFFRPFRERPDTPPAPNGLKILLVGELAYNSERVLALEELGHQLYGLWMPDPYWYNSVGPLPFGHVQDLPLDNWQAAVRRIKPDIIYALLNWQAVPLAHEVLLENPGIPFVWHFKEGPFICLEKGTWKELADLYTFSDGQIYCSPEMRDWFETVLPGSVSQGLPYVLDGDLPKQEWFKPAPSARLSEADGEIHTVVPGRPIGLHPHNVAELADQGVHLHFYGDFTHSQWLEWIEKTRRLAPRHIHLHSNVDQRQWVAEFSQYDAGWLHYFKSDNHGQLRRANWDDLNYPARISTLVCAGLPVLQYDNSGSIVATQSLVQQHDIGLFFNSMESLRSQMDDQPRMAEIRANVWRARPFFTFDHHAPALIDYFYKVIEQHASRASASKLARTVAQKEENGRRQTAASD